jgi:hypothetical protein
MHFAGNAGYVDTRGFIVAETLCEGIGGCVAKARIRSVERVSRFYNEERIQNARDTCWIC